jgi:5-methyltetrahydropteroyltriglutamate--homocysteine methyltransferase
MAEREMPPFRADHVGSLLRPAELLQARAEHQAGRISAEELRRVEDDAIRAAARMQHEIGLRSITDGEFRRRSWHMDFLYQIGGVTRTDQLLRLPFRNETGAVEAALGGFRITAKLGLDKTIFGEDFAFLRSVAPAGTTAKLTIPSPSMLHYRGGRAAIDPSLYADIEAFWDDLATVYRQEIARLAALGCSYLQLDDTSLAYLNDPAQRAFVTSIGGDGATQHLTNIKVINAALAGRPPGMTITTHMCRGNFRSSWMAEGGYDHVAEALFGELAVDGFFLEYDDARSGGFAPLRFVPRGEKQVVLGLVTSKRAALESKDELKRRIDEAAKYVPLEQLCLSPQCGFSSTVEGNALSIEQQNAKLRLVVETAREVWGE